MASFTSQKGLKALIKCINDISAENEVLSQSTTKIDWLTKRRMLQASGNVIGDCKRIDIVTLMQNEQNSRYKEQLTQFFYMSLNLYSRLFLTRMEVVTNWD